MANNLRIIFIGTPEFSAIVLERMIKTGYLPIMVITSPDKPIGRHAYQKASKQILTPSPVKALAEENKIPVLQSENIKNLKLEIANLQPELIVLVAFGQIISKEILEIPKYGCLNLHPSLLPKYRGASPIQAAILNGDAETGATIMLMDDQLDHGSIIANDKLLLTKNETIETLTKKLAELGAELLVKTIPKWVNKEINAQPQDDSMATFTKTIEKEDGRINWRKSAEEIERMIEAYNPWPGVYARLKIKNDKFKFLRIIKVSVLRTEDKKEPGMVFLTEKKGLAIACDNNAIVLEKVQLEGKNIMDTKSFLNGYPWIVGSVLN